GVIFHRSEFGETGSDIEKCGDNGGGGGFEAVSGFEKREQRETPQQDQSGHDDVDENVVPGFAFEGSAVDPDRPNHMSAEGEFDALDGDAKGHDETDDF